jgi:hypothetical protein
MNVRISAELQNDVRMHVRSMYLKDMGLQLGSSDYDKLFYSDGSNTELIDLVWGEHLHLKSQMPTNWMKDLSKEYNPHIYLKVQLAADPVSGDSKHTQFRIIIAGKKPFLVPPRQSSGSVFTMDDKNLTGDLRKLYDLYHQYEELQEKWDKISNDIITYLRSAKSLNSALKNWAELRAFIPQEFLDRVDAKPERTAERKKAEESLASIDRNLAVTSATLVKLAMT